MKVKALICSLVLVSVLLLGPNTIAQTFEKSRSVEKAFKIKPETEIEISNKYGDVNLIIWKKDSVRFKIDIEVKSSKESRVDKSFDFIDTDFKASEYYVIAQTLFGGKSSFWSDVSDLTSAIFNSSTKTKIDYTVYLPAYANLKVTNKFGNIYTTDLTGPVEINLSNGDLKAHDFMGETNITSEFANLDINHIDHGKLDISYGELRLEQGGALEITSKSSRIEIDGINSLKVDSKRDKYYLNHVDDLLGSNYFSLMEINELGTKISLTAKYGDIEVKRFADHVNSFDIKSDNTDITLHFTDDKFYKMDFTVDEKTEVMYSADIKKIKSSEPQGDEKLITMKASVGRESNKNVPLNLDCRGGTLTLKLK